MDEDFRCACFGPANRARRRNRGQNSIGSGGGPMEISRTRRQKASRSLVVKTTALLFRAQEGLVARQARFVDFTIRRRLDVCVVVFVSVR
jgi:hypothetical protein